MWLKRHCRPDQACARACDTGARARGTPLRALPVRAHPLVSQCVVLGDNQPFIAALVTLDADAIKSWATANKKANTTAADLCNDPDLLAVIQTAIDDANKAVSRAESIRKFTILPVDFSIADGQLTAKLSVKRHVIAQQFSKEISELFA